MIRRTRNSQSARAWWVFGIRSQRTATMIVLIDNYDSFVHNLAGYFECLGQRTLVLRNDEVDVAGVSALAPNALVISPGPCTPDQAGASLNLVREFGGRIPILGVCLGHQAVAQAYGARIVRGSGTRTWPLDRCDPPGARPVTGAPVSYTSLPLPFSDGGSRFCAEVHGGSGTDGRRYRYGRPAPTTIDVWSTVSP